MIEIEAITHYLSELDITAKHIQLLSGGRNNRVYKVETLCDTLCIKSYSKISENHDRFNSEHKFLIHANKLAPKAVPTLVGANSNKRLLLLEWIPGSLFADNNIRQNHIKQIGSFLEKINNNKYADLPNAADSHSHCHAHIEEVNIRLAKLVQASQLDGSLKDFTHEVLLPTWKSIEKTLKHNFNPKFDDFSLTEFVSPSDLGFHNILIQNDELKFIDFEYAGYDDPAKLVTDFFCQPRYPVNIEYLSYFTELIGPFVSNYSALTGRIKWLFPVIRMKWCCIQLNEFLPDKNKHREFALGKAEANRLRSKKIEQVKNYLRNSELSEYLDTIQSI